MKHKAVVLPTHQWLWCVGQGQHQVGGIWWWCISSSMGNPWHLSFNANSKMWSNMWSIHPWFPCRWHPIIIWIRLGHLCDHCNIGSEAMSAVSVFGISTFAISLWQSLFVWITPQAFITFLFITFVWITFCLWLISQARCWEVMTLIISMLKGSGAIWSGQSWKASCAIQMPLDFELVISFFQCLKGSKGSKTNNYQSGNMFWICLDIHSSEADIKEKLEISSPWGQSARHYKEKSTRYEAWVW